MFGAIGVTELLVLAAVALMVMGPEKFPEFAKTMAKMYKDVRGYVSDAQREFTKEMKPVKDEFDKLSKIDPESYIEKLAEKAIGDTDEDSDRTDPASDFEDDDDGTYNPEPEGPTMDDTYQYGSFGGSGDPTDDDSEQEHVAGGGDAPDEDVDSDEGELPERLDG